MTYYALCDILKKKAAGITDYRTSVRAAKSLQTLQRKHYLCCCWVMYKKRCAGPIVRDVRENHRSKSNSSKIFFFARLGPRRRASRCHIYVEIMRVDLIQ